jgi:hypothetical protein
MFLSFAGGIWVLALDRVSRDVDTGQITFDLDFNGFATRLRIFWILMVFILLKLIADVVWYHS